MTDSDRALMLLIAAMVLDLHTREQKGTVARTARAISYVFVLIAFGMLVLRLMERLT